MWPNYRSVFRHESSPHCAGTWYPWESGKREQSSLRQKKSERARLYWPDNLCVFGFCDIAFRGQHFILEIAFSDEESCGGSTGLSFLPKIEQRLASSWAAGRWPSRVYFSDVLPRWHFVRRSLPESRKAPTGCRIIFCSDWGCHRFQFLGLGINLCECGHKSDF